MDDRPSWLPQGVDLKRASAARCYDFLLGGAHNFAADREFAREALKVTPNLRELAQDNRAFLRRTVRYALHQGIRQFLDIGSGIPTVGNVHEIAGRVDPAARVVYVDNEPVAVAHCETMLEGNQHATVVHADLTDVDAVLDAPETQRMLDFSQPVAIMMVAVLHFISEQRHPKDVIAQYQRRLATGSLLALSHAIKDDQPEQGAALAELYKDTTNPGTLRSYSQVKELLSSFELVDPGLVPLPEWHPDSPEDIGSTPGKTILYGAVGRKPSGPWAAQ